MNILMRLKICLVVFLCAGCFSQKPMVENYSCCPSQETWGDLLDGAGGQRYQLWRAPIPEDYNFTFTSNDYVVNLRLVQCSQWEVISTGFGGNESEGVIGTVMPSRQIPGRKYTSGEMELVELVLDEIDGRSISPSRFYINSQFIYPVNTPGLSSSEIYALPVFQSLEFEVNVYDRKNKIALDTISEMMVFRCDVVVGYLPDQ